MLNWPSLELNYSWKRQRPWSNFSPYHVLKSLEETLTLKATSHTQAVTKIEQPPHMKDMSIEELMTQHMNEEQQRSLPNILEVKPGKRRCG